ncbi:MAG: hypothetical protein JNL10_22110 [Verrucomicrobiales bacterium]|nr:hypothetical protein [Verrucomicrobiales bacterium]
MPRVQEIRLLIVGTLLALCTSFEADAGGMFLGSTDELSSSSQPNAPTGLVVSQPPGVTECRPQWPGDMGNLEQESYRAVFQSTPPPTRMTFTPLSSVPEPTAAIAGAGLVCILVAAVHRRRRTIQRG